MKTSLMRLIVAGAVSLLAFSAVAGDVDMAKELEGNLSVVKGSALAPYTGKLSDIKFYAVYSSASWCGPCRAFTPELVKFYNRAKSKHPELEVVFLSADRSEADMIEYMKEDKMKWPAMKYGAKTQVNKFSGSGIPCLVVVDAEGKVLSHSYENGNYVGPQKVMDDLEKLLKKSESESSKGSSESFFSK